jgi:hypothetical protein
MYKASTKLVVSAICAAIFCISAISHAAFINSGTVYKTVHKDGTVTYSDQPSPGAVAVEFDVPTSTIQSNVRPSPTQPQINSTPKVNYKVLILSPEPDATIRNNVGELSIGASLEPKVGGFFQLHINDEIHESATGMFRLSSMNRGTYQYSVKFIDNTGKLIASSDTRNVYLHQASALIK